MPLDKVEVDEEGHLLCPKCGSICRIYTPKEPDPGSDEEEFVAHCQPCGFMCARGRRGRDILAKLAADLGVNVTFDRLGKLN